MFTLFLVVMTVAWVAMFVLPLIGYAILGLSLLKSYKVNQNVPTKRSEKLSLHLTASHV